MVSPDKAAIVGQAGCKVLLQLPSTAASPITLTHQSQKGMNLQRNC
jgi:hypothetical protein